MEQAVRVFSLTADVQTEAPYMVVSMLPQLLQNALTPGNQREVGHASD